MIDEDGNRLELTVWADDPSKLELTAYNRNYFSSSNVMGEAGTL